MQWSQYTQNTTETKQAERDIPHVASHLSLVLSGFSCSSVAGDPMPQPYHSPVHAVLFHLSLHTLGASQTMFPNRQLGIEYDVYICACAY